MLGRWDEKPAKKKLEPRFIQISFAGDLHPPGRTNNKGRIP